MFLKAKVTCRVAEKPLRARGAAYAWGARALPSTTSGRLLSRGHGSFLHRVVTLGHAQDKQANPSQLQGSTPNSKMGKRCCLPAGTMKPKEDDNVRTRRNAAARLERPQTVT